MKIRWSPEAADDLQRICERIAVDNPEAANRELPGYRLHPLKGEFRGFWPVTVRANWRIMFRFQGEGNDDHEKSAASRPQYTERMP